MDMLALAVAVLSLIISVAAYCRSGAKQNISAIERALNQKLEQISAIAQRAADEVTANIKAGYQRSRRVIADLQSRLAALREDAIEEIREDIGKLTAILDRLNERAASELQEMKVGANFKMAEMEAGLWLSVEDAKAHLKMIEAKRDLLLARRAIARNDLVEAEARVESAAKHIDEARSLALGHHESLDALQKQTQAMLAAIRAQADTMKTSIDALIERSKRLLNELRDIGAAARTVV
jgi:uncharacterized phage infection (PIP) family protein YhgE